VELGSDVSQARLVGLPRARVEGLLVLKQMFDESAWKPPFGGFGVGEVLLSGVGVVVVVAGMQLFKEVKMLVVQAVKEIRIVKSGLTFGYYLQLLSVLSPRCPLSSSGSGLHMPRSRQ